MSLDDRKARGSINRDQRTCGIVGDALGEESGTPGTENQTYGDLNQLRTIAHEIDHILVGEGHPGDPKGKVGKAPLKDTDYTRRLMVGGKMQGPAPGNMLVKGEWDEAEEWLRSEELNNRINP